MGVVKAVSYVLALGHLAKLETRLVVPFEMLPVRCPLHEVPTWLYFNANFLLHALATLIGVCTPVLGFGLKWIRSDLGLFIQGQLVSRVVCIIGRTHF